MVVLAEQAGISAKKLSKLELGRHSLRDQSILITLADIFDVHPNELLRRAALTLMLRPSVSAMPVSEPALEVFPPLVTPEESKLLEDYLEFVRFKARLDQLPSP